MRTLPASRAFPFSLNVFGGILFLLASACTHAEASEVELGEAPELEVSQDTSGWVRPIPPKAAKTRADVVQLYQTAYLGSGAVALAWTGNVAGCVAGNTNVAHQQAVIARVNYYRALVDLPAVSLGGTTPTVQSQAAALMMSANNALNHAPPTSWACYSADGAAGAAKANLAIGSNGVGAIDLFVDDPGPTNTATGHRRWILFPPRADMATGDTSGGTMPPRPTNALHVLGGTTARPATPDGIAWPPAGFVPYQNLPSRSNRWSFSYPNAQFTGAQVAMTGPAGSIPVTIEPLATGFGDNTIVFLPTGIPYTKPAADTPYTITVSNVGGAGVPPTFSYTVAIIDPDVAPPGLQGATAVEYYNAALDHYFVTHLPGEIATLDAGVTIRGWTRTGETFGVYAAGGAGTSPVCRYYIPPASGDSHFYGRGTTECSNTGLANPTFVNEDAQFFHVVLPVNGVCPAGTRPIYRVFSNRPDANHRYLVSRTLREQMATRGWLIEGDGPDFVVMCGPP